MKNRCQQTLFLFTGAGYPVGCSSRATDSCPARLSGIVFPERTRVPDVVPALQSQSQKVSNSHVRSLADQTTLPAVISPHSE